MDSKEVWNALKQLEKLHQQGQCSTQEYETKKEELLGQLVEPTQREELQTRMGAFATRSGKDKPSTQEPVSLQELAPRGGSQTKRRPSQNEIVTLAAASVMESSDGSQDEMAVDAGQLLCDRFRLKEQLGVGGMGQVFLAEDVRFRSDYALKVFHPWMMNNERSVQGFIQEFKLLERLTHVGVVRTFALFEDPTTGYLFYTMEFVHGHDLQSLLEDAQEKGEEEKIFTLEETVRFIENLAHVLRYIHSQRVVHRDLKPGNIMVIGPRQRIKLLDFGIAKFLKKESTFHTGYKGTFFYIAPEQLVGGEEVKPAADVFSLGVILYQLLTGEIPVGMAVLPSELNTELNPAIDGMVRKAMHPRWEQRYQTVDEFLLDFRRVFAHVRQPGGRMGPAQGSKGPKRNLTPTGNVRFQDRSPSASHSLTPLPKQKTGSHYLHREQTAPWRAVGQDDLVTQSPSIHTLEAHHMPVSALAMSHDGKKVASGSHDRSIKIWEMGSWFLMYGLSGHKNTVTSLQWSPTSRWLCSSSTDRTVRIWDMASVRTRHVLEHPASVNIALWDADGKMLISGSSDHKVRIWEPETARLLYTLEGHQRGISALDLDASGRYLLSGSHDKSVKLWELASGRLLHSFGPFPDAVNDLQFRPNSSMFVAACQNGTLEVWDWTTFQRFQSFLSHHSSIQCMVISASGQWIATGGNDHRIHINHTKTGRVLHALTQHHGPISGLCISKDDKRILSCSHDRTVRLWESSSFMSKLSQY